ncbi:Phosphoglycerate kinase chloroplastic, partial [Dissostichus eleginoides]
MPLIAVLSKAQLLMSDIEKLLDWCGPTMQREASSVEEDGETLVIEGSRFESAVSREDLSRHLSDGYLSGFITQSQQEPCCRITDVPP